MNKIALLLGAVAALSVGGWVAFAPKGEANGEVEYRYAKAERGTIVRSISASGQVVALTTVDVKSKAGGKVVRLAVEEGTKVKQGDLIAVIDPSDTQAIYDQAMADLQSSSARADQARKNMELQVAQSRTAVAEAQAALEAARVRLQGAIIESQRQPRLSRSSVDTATANLRSAEADLDRFLRVTAPQIRREVVTNVDRARTTLETAEANLKRQQDLLAKGYVAQSQVDQAQSALGDARAAEAQARQRQATLEAEVGVSERSVRLAVTRAEAALEQARAGTSDIDLQRNAVEEARKAVRQAEINLQQARDNVIQNEIRRSEITAAQAGIVRNRVSADNAKVQLDSTTVVAPRDGVVTMKYLEEGTIIPPGTSTFAQGTSLVQISDVTELYVECAVDEADIGNVEVGQSVKIVTEAYPGEEFRGVVTRVNPAAVTANNLTAVKVRVKVLPDTQPRRGKAEILPGMNATCEFITLEKPNVLVVPSQAVTMGEGDQATVKVKAAEGAPPVVKTVTVGASGNDGIEILSGLTEGEEVVTAEINLAELRETQRRMDEVKQGGGLAGGAPGGGRGGGGGRR
jgi:HlyD family secretion protein